ncbi:MAG: hypothetical protein ABSG99_02690 [Sedimentisphaerales bacterium]
MADFNLLLTRKKVIKVLAESAKGTKVAATSAILAYDLAIDSTAPFEERKGTGLYRGQERVGTLGALSGSCKFKTELRGNGTSGMDTGLAILLQGCGLKQTSESYQIHSAPADDKTISIDVFEDGVQKGLRGASSDLTIGGENGGKVMCDFDFQGIWQAPVYGALPSWTPGTGAVLKMQGGTFTLANATIKIAKFSLKLGCKVVPRYDMTAAGGIIYYMITDYDPVLSIDPEAALVADHDYYGLWLAGTPAAVSLVLTNGTTKVTITLPAVQYKELKEGDRDGIQIYDLTGQCNHSSGNDAVTIAAAAA